MKNVLTILCGGLFLIVTSVAGLSVIPSDAHAAPGARALVNATKRLIKLSARADRLEKRLILAIRSSKDMDARLKQRLIHALNGYGNDTDGDGVKDQIDPDICNAAVDTIVDDFGREIVLDN